MGENPAFRAAAVELGRGLARAGITMVYGGGGIGLMGVCADAALAAGGKVVGIIPHHLYAREVKHDAITELHVVDDMHQRKRLMFDKSDAFAVLPGGIGTLDEMCEVITWRQLGQHDKPILVIDTADYWRPFRDLIRHVIRTEFADNALTQLFTVVPDVAAALDAFSRGTPR